MNVFSFSSSAKGQITQTTPLIEARQEKTREFQTQLLHYSSESDNKSNHYHFKGFANVFLRWTYLLYVPKLQF